MLDVHVVVVGDGIEADEFGTVVVGEQLLAEVAANKAGGSGNENGFAVECNIFIKHN